MMLRIRPELVGDYKAARTVPQADPVRAGQSRLDHQGPHRSRATSAQPQHATAEKGELLFRLFSDDVAAFLERVIAWDGKSEVT